MCLRGSVPFFNRLLCGPMNVSVIIPALDEAARIRESIDRAWVAGADEVIVGDGGSKDYGYSPKNKPAEKLLRALFRDKAANAADR